MANSRLFEGFMIVSDMDGTLLNSKFEVSEENRKALEYFVEGGGLFTIATGRMEVGVERYVRNLPVNAPVILYNGALICDFYNKSTLWSKCLEGDVGIVLKELLEEFPTLGIEVFQGGNVYYLRENEETDKHYKKEGFIPEIVSIDKVPEPWYKVILTTRPDELPKVEKYLEGRDRTFRMVYSEPQFLELLHRDASKGTALEELAAITGVSLCNILSIGDNCNDIEMVELSGMGFAVENANTRLKKIARYSCCHHDEHAAKYVVAWLESALK
ncbi:MAG: HAD family hydrolase [Clostridiaceae bacterium]|nr:HAD family hydrolase [Clostridiaceae bacterium]